MKKSQFLSEFNKFTLVPVFIIYALFQVSSNVSLNEEGGIIFFSGISLLVWMVGGLLGGWTYFAMIRILFTYANHPDAEKALRRVAIPFYGLFILPAYVFVLHPLGVPHSLGVYLEPFFVGTVFSALSFSVSIAELSKCTFCLRVWKWGNAWRTHKKVLALFFIFFSGFYGLGIELNNRKTVLVGDEPHYLFLMESLKRYHSPELTPLLQDTEYSDGVRRVRPHRSGESKAGKTYSVHHLGIPLLILPFHLLFGYSGVMFFFALMTALLICNLYLYLYEISGRFLASAGVAFLAGVTAPFILYFRFIYPDLVAATLLLYAYRQFRKSSLPYSRFLLGSMAAATLPWLHVKYLLFGLLLFVFALYRRQNWRRNLLTIGLVYSLSAIPMMLYFHHAFGSWLPNAQYGGNNPPVSRWFWRGGPGLLFDRDHGLFAWAPYLVFSLVGIGPMVQKYKKEFIRILIIVLPSFAIFSSHWMWWGGPCPAGRFILPLTPFLFLFLLCSLDKLRSWFWLPLLGTGVIFSFFAAKLSFVDPRYLPFHRHILYSIFPGMEGYPSLPIFFIHRSQEVPISSFQGFWILSVLGLLLVAHGFSSRPFITAGRYPLAAFLTGGVLAFFLPGTLSVVQAHLDGENPLAVDTNRSLARMNFSFDRLFNKGVNQNTDENIEYPYYEYDIKRGHSGSITEESYQPGKDKWIMVGDYSTLYPLPYKVTFHLTVEGSPGSEVGMLDIAAEHGHIILAETPIVAEPGKETQSVTLHCTPDQTLNSTEFRCRLTNVGKVTVHRIHVEVGGN